MNNVPTYKPLVELLEEIPDVRRDQGKRYSLKSILILTLVAMSCGYDSYSAIAEWGKNYKEFVGQLGFTKGTPCSATFYMLLPNINAPRSFMIFELFY